MLVVLGAIVKVSGGYGMVGKWDTGDDESSGSDILR